MALEVYRYEGKGTIRNRFVTCPLCGHSFEKNELRWRHFYDEHGPEDCGLSPIGESPPDVDRPLLDGLKEGSA